MRKSSLFFVLLLFMGFSCSDDKNESETQEPLEATEFFDVQYSTGSQQTFDLFLPEDRTQTSTKVIVLIHGGGWTSGDKNDLIAVYNYLKENFNGYAIANLNYTLADLNTPPVPLQIDDIDLFLDHFKENAETYAVNPEFAFIGTSAGAHLSMLYGYKNNPNDDVKVVCNIVGPTDFLHESYLETIEPETAELIANVQTIYGLPIDGNNPFYESISPFYLVDGSIPPTISFYGGQDNLVPEEQGIVLKEVLDSNNVVNEYILYENEGHGWGEPEFFDTLTRIETFLSSNF